MKKYWFLMLLSAVTFFSCSVAPSQKNREKIVSSPDAPDAKLLTRFSFEELPGGVLLIKADINDSGKLLNFILDTGSSSLTLDSTTAEELKLDVRKTERVRRTEEEKRIEFYVYGVSLSFPSLKIEKLNFNVHDISFISALYGLKIDGIVGYPFLKKYLISIDYDKKEIAVYTPGRFVYPLNGWLSRPNLITVPVIPAELENKEQPVRSHFYFDIGAGLNFMIPNRFAEEKELFKTARQRRHKFVIMENYGFSGKMEMTKTVLGRVKIGPYQFKKVPVYLFDDKDKVLSTPSMGGIVGNDLLRKFNVILNYPRKEIFLSPNSNFKKGFGYSYYGFNMNVIQGHVVISGVMPDSPAERKDFRTGDLILSIDGDASQDVLKYQKLLGKAGKVVNIRIFREGKVLEKELRIESIL